MKKTILFLFLAACGSSASGHTTGDLGGQCYANGTCNAGLMCDGMMCVDGPDGGVPGDGKKPTPDAPVDALICPHDQYEPNNFNLQATMLSIGANQQINVQASICPDDDQDWFVVTMPNNNTTLSIDLIFNSANLIGGIYIDNGGEIAALAPFMGSNTHSTATATNLSPGTTYAVKVWSNNLGVSPLYSLTIKASP